MSSIDVFVQQVAQRRKEQWEEQQRQEQEEVQEREELRLQEEELRLETERMNRQGYQQRVSEDSSNNEDPVFMKCTNWFIFFHHGRFTADPGQHGHESDFTGRIVVPHPLSDARMHFRGYLYVHADLGHFVH